VAEHMAVRILCQESEQSFLPAATFGNVMFFHQGVVAMKGDSMEVEIEGRTQSQAPMADGIEPGVHQFGVAGRWDATTIFGQEGAFGNDVEAGKQGESFIQDMTHDVAV